MFLQHQFRRVFVPQGVWKRSHFYCFNLFLMHKRAWCPASCLPLYQRPCRLASVKTVPISHKHIHTDAVWVYNQIVSPNYLLSSAALASDLAQYDIVSKLLLLLASPNLNPEDTLSVLLTLSYCTESSGKTFI